MFLSENEESIAVNSFKWSLTENATLKYDLSGTFDKYQSAWYIHTDEYGNTNEIDLRQVTPETLSGILTFAAGNHEIYVESSISSQKFASITVALDIL